MEPLGYGASACGISAIFASTSLLDRAREQLDDEILAPLTHSEREMLNVLLTRAVMHIGAECADAHDGGCHS